MITKLFNGLSLLSSFKERFEYLKLEGFVGRATIGQERYFSQALYKSREWKYIRRDVIVRDGGCDLGVPGFEIQKELLIHHINPITTEDIHKRAPCIFDLNNLICTTVNTHNAIHLGDASLLISLPPERRKGDTILWRT